MRIAASLLATLALTTSIPARSAEACGGDYGPRAPAMFLVAQHHGRTFVLLGGAVPDKETLEWKGEEMSYDRTEIAAAPALAENRYFTLVGNKRVRALSSRNQVFITPVFESRRAMNAIEFFPRDPEPARIAIEGDHYASWSDLQSIEPGLETVAWAQNPGFTPALDTSSIYVSTVRGGKVDFITAYSNGKPVTYVRPAGSRPYGGYAGSPHGVVMVDAVRYLVLVNDGVVTPIRI